MLASGYYNVIMEPRQDYHSFITVSDHGVITRLFQGHFSLIVGSLQKKKGRYSMTLRATAISSQGHQSLTTGLVQCHDRVSTCNHSVATVRSFGCCTVILGFSFSHIRVTAGLLVFF